MYYLFNVFWNNQHTNISTIVFASHRLKCKYKNWWFTCSKTAEIILGQVLSIITCGSQTHTEVIVSGEVPIRPLGTFPCEIINFKCINHISWIMFLSMSSSEDQTSRDHFFVIFLSLDFRELMSSVISVHLITDVKQQWAALVFFLSHKFSCTSPVSDGCAAHACRPTDFSALLKQSAFKHIHYTITNCFSTLAILKWPTSLHGSFKTTWGFKMAWPF